MLDASDGPLTFLRYGLARKKKFLKDVRDSYDGLTLPANILLYQYKSTPSVVTMCQKPFIVDPMSYLFGQPYEEFKKRVKAGPAFKPSFKKLMEGHGLASDNFLQYEYTRLMKFLKQDINNIKIFSNNAIAFQKNLVWDTLHSVQDLMTAEQVSLLSDALCRPKIIIPPYFLYTFDTNGNPSITSQLNQQILNHCWENMRAEGDLFPMVFLSKDCLTNDFYKLAADIVLAHEFPGYCVWIDSFDERYVERPQIISLIKLIKSLSSRGQQVIVMYGGFFTLLLYYFGVSCVSHGLAYGESRSIGATAQVGTGPAPVRYYIYELHRFFTLDDALKILRERTDLVCECPVCRRVLQGDPENVTMYQNEETLAEMHFLYNRYQERSLISSNNLQNSIEHLNWIIDINEDINSITKEYKSGLSTWEKSIVDTEYIQDWKVAIESAS